ncbi:nuclease-related domain-containing protein [Alkalicoccobacillus gibsonii]|uniref:nuclease-related domain-containing protein n=1 Tax=Alkalicoccobacillus gibsonii TaxID=79881 RepID=UPI003F7C4C01
MMDKEGSAIKLIKERSIPIKLKQLRAIHARLAPTHTNYKTIYHELTKRELGLQGERTLDYHLQFLNDDFILIHDLRMNGINQTFFQIDTLILCPQFISIIEVKNIAGSIHFEQTSGQMIRKLHDRMESLPNPLTQIHRQQIQLQHFLLNHQFPSIPIKTLITFSNSTTLIETDHPSIVRTEFLPSKLEKLQSQFPAKKLKAKELNKLVDCLKNAHVPERTYPLETYSIKPSDLRKGVDCPSCNHPHMTRSKKNGSWYCIRCKHFSKTAHLHAIEQFSTILDKKLTNKEVRTYLLIDSRHTAYRLLKEFEGTQ